MHKQNSKAITFDSTFQSKCLNNHHSKSSHSFIYRHLIGVTLPTSSHSLINWKKKKINSEDTQGLTTHIFKWWKSRSLQIVLGQINKKNIDSVDSKHYKQWIIDYKICGSNTRKYIHNMDTSCRFVRVLNIVKSILDFSI